LRRTIKIINFQRLDSRAKLFVSRKKFGLENLIWNAKRFSIQNFILPSKLEPSSFNVLISIGDISCQFIVILHCFTRRLIDSILELLGKDTTRDNCKGLFTP
jgi:hypothetical protein